MISVLISREFSWTFELSKIELEKVLVAVNNKRRNAKYLNPKAAIAVLRTDVKIPLTSNPFYCDFEYRKNCKGY